jgi:hypothetical protein
MAPAASLRGPIATAPRRKAKQQNLVLRLLSSLALPAALGSYAIYRLIKYRRSKKQQPADGTSKAASSAAASKGRAKPRKEYKLNKGAKQSALGLQVELWLFTACWRSTVFFRPCP